MEEVLGQVSFCQPFIEALKVLGSPQVKNAATIGGSIFWRHSSSDLWPLYLVYGCKIRYLNVAHDTEHVVMIENVLEEGFKELILELIIPNTGEGKVGQFRLEIIVSCINKYYSYTGCLREEFTTLLQSFVVEM